MEKDVCDVTIVHQDRVSRVQKEMKIQPVNEVATIYKMLADKNRLKIAYSLLIEKELCVCDLSAIIGASTATTSHHLRQLYKAGIASSRRDGKLVYYFLIDNHIKELVQSAFTHMKECATDVS